MKYFTSSIIKVVTVVYGLLLLKILSTFLTEYEFSKYYLYNNIILYGTSIIFGLQGSIVLRYKPVYGAIITNKITTMLNSISIFVIFFFVFVTGVFLDNYQFSIILLLVTVFGGWFSILLAKFRSNQQYCKVLLAVLLQAIVMVSILYAFRKSITALSSLTIVFFSFFVTLLFLEGVDINKYTSIPNFKYLKEYRKVFNYSIPFVFIATSNFMMSSMDQYFLNYLGHKDILSAYIANYNIAEKSIFSLLSIITLVFVPKIFNTYKELSKEAFREISTVSLYFTILSVFILVFVTYFSNDLTAILTNKKYTNLSWIIPYIGAGGILLGINSILSEILTVQYKSNLILYCYLLGILTNTILNFIFIEKYGVNGAIATTIFSYLVTLLATSYFILREYRNLDRENTFNEQ